MATFASILVGDSTLLIRCGEHLLSQGHTLAAVLTQNERIRRWCKENGIQHLAKDSPNLRSSMEQLSFDVLFSIANLSILPDWMLQQAHKAAFNFHDSPLPRYAGLNATTWALLAGETTHGITWHELTPNVDAGRIAVQKIFPVHPQETAFSLNTRCYEAGLQAFEELVEQLANDQLQLTEQVGETTYFSRSHRPEHAGFIDPQQTVEQTIRLVQALDYGPYWNAVGDPKLLAGGRLFLARTASAEVANTQAPAGRILSRESNSVVVSMSDGWVRLGQLEHPNGQTVNAENEPALAPGQSITSGATLPTSWHELAQASAQSEHYWLRKLEKASKAQLPYPQHLQRSDGEAPAQATHQHKLEVDLSQLSQDLETSPEVALLTGLSIWLNRLTGFSSALLSYRSPQTQQEGIAANAAFASLRWLRTSQSPDDTVRTAAKTIEKQLQRSLSEGPIPRDLQSRLKRMDAPTTWPTPLVEVNVDAPSNPAPLHNRSLQIDLDSLHHSVTLKVNANLYVADVAEAIAEQLTHVLCQLASHREKRLGSYPLVPESERQMWETQNQATQREIPFAYIDESFRTQAQKTPNAIAVRWHEQSWTYNELDRHVTSVATKLANQGVGPGTKVGLSLERTPAMVAALLGVLLAGAAYVPLDPRLPQARKDFIKSDSQATFLITAQTSLLDEQQGAKLLRVEELLEVSESVSDSLLVEGRSPTDLAYLTYTSGSTGRPKGVAVTHANVINFFSGMDERIPHQGGGTWLAVTSISFDISVLELLWTLSRGFTVALHSNVSPTNQTESPSLSLFYFAAAEGAGADRDTYRLLLEGARFADANGFEAIWTPERHFYEFGGIYPNPAITGAAVASVTKNVHIRAGSCVLPLHDPIRITEDWSVLDNLSNGRTGVAFASGWMPEDFVLAPDSFTRRKALMMEKIDTIETLWRGESITRETPEGKATEIKTVPRPVQERLPIWLTAARNPQTFEMAAQRGYNILTHLLGMSAEELEANIQRYHKAWSEAGHPGRGRITLMLHTFVGVDDETVRETVREPMKRYLGSSFDLVRAANWNFPTIVRKQEAPPASEQQELTEAELSPEEMDALLEHAFARYYETSGLFGTPERCATTIRRLSALGVDEFACLIDFGVETETTLQSLHHLKDVMNLVNAGASRAHTSLPDDFSRHHVTHFQCTPSMAAMLLADEEGKRAIAGLDAMLVGGEALPPAMAQELLYTVKGPVFNMYGPTETTIWSTSARLEANPDPVPLGEPITNTTLAIVDDQGQDCPAYVPGELWIGGDGVAQGYWQREELTHERFQERVVDGVAQRCYKTGDRVQRHRDGTLAFLGRMDQQIKLRGHRIELGEIESILSSQDNVSQAAVLLEQNEAKGPSLRAFVSPQSIEPSQLKAALAKQLPAVMVPQHITVLDRLPQTTSGKVDRLALAQRTSQTSPMPLPPKPSGSSAAPTTTTSTRATDVESTLSTLWQELLGTPSVGLDDNFFDLGGHSLLAVQMHRRLAHNHTWSLKLTDIFRFPTIRGLAQHLSQQATPVEQASPKPARAVAQGQNRARMRMALRRRPATSTGSRSDGGSDE
ncbi:MAG: LLM class flavin-dependent oxidoreductase [Deltaproteobacteria bacterium]|nr:MAG: LLM class flavin-dependent oxidoreductase [Deltaproteobacteria bacterium]